MRTQEASGPASKGQRASGTSAWAPKASISNHPTIRLQQSIGNQAVQRLIARDANASETAAGYDYAGSTPASLEEIVSSGTQSAGHPLDSETRRFMEERFGYDFSQVRTHTDSAAADSSHAVAAHAYTLGQDVVFGAGKYSPGSSEGRKLIAHELAHVVQQSTGALPMASSGEGISISEPSDQAEQEAESTADRVMGGSHLTAGEPAAEARGGGDSGSSATVQRDGIDDIDPTGPTSYPPGHTDTELPGGGDLETPQFPQAPKVPEIPEPPPGGFPELPPGGTLAGEGAAEGGAEAAAGLGAEAILPVALAGAAGVGAGIGMGKLADSSYTKTGAFGVNQDTGQNQSAMDWGANWGTAVDKKLGNTDPSVLGGIAAGAGGIVGGIGGAVYGAGNWLADKL